MTKHQCSVAAEAFSAYLLSRAGYHVSVQYGANQPGYDLIAEKATRKSSELLRISVKGNQDGGWMVASSYKTRENTYLDAIDHWERDQHPDNVFMYVQFDDIPLNGVPNCYVVRPKELGAYLRRMRDGAGDCVLRMQPIGSTKSHKVTEPIPSSWEFTQHRIDAV